jgi:predicted metal-dependent hydrolase
MRYKDIEYSLTRSQRKTASLHIERDGTVSLIVPETLPQEKIEEVLEAKRLWVYRGLAEWRDRNAARVPREFVNGEGFLYLGRSYLLRWVDDQKEPLILKDGRFLLRRPADGKPSPDPAEIFKEFYRIKGRERISQRVSLYEPKIGVKSKAVRIMELGHRWASCSADTVLNFHWKSMMAPLKILDYIVVHELAHLVHPRHTVEFWGTVDKILPDYRERRDWLRDNGAAMEV